MRRHLAVLTLAVMATACGNMSPEEQARTRQALSVACNVDGVIVPMAQPVVAELGPAGATAARVDLQVHPAVVAACEMLHGVPVTVAGAQPPAPEVSRN